MSLAYSLIIGGALLFVASGGLLWYWLTVDGVTLLIPPFVLLMILVMSPFLVAMGFAARREP